MVITRTMPGRFSMTMEMTLISSEKTKLFNYLPIASTNNNATNTGRWFSLPIESCNPQKAELAKIKYLYIYITLSVHNFK